MSTCVVCRSEGVELGGVVGLHEADGEAEGDSDEPDVLPGGVLEAQGSTEHPDWLVSYPASFRDKNQLTARFMYSSNNNLLR